MNITSDSTVVDMVKGCTLEFATYPHQPCQPKEINFSSRECLAIKIELQRLLDKGIIIPSEHETCEFISTIFVRPKAKENVTDTVNIFQGLILLFFLPTAFVLHRLVLLRKKEYL